MAPAPQTPQLLPAQVPLLPAWQTNVPSRAHGMLRRWQHAVEGARLPTSPWPQYSLSGVQSVKRGTSRGTLSMCCRCGRTWWMPLGSLAWRKQRNRWPQGQKEGSLHPPPSPCQAHHVPPPGVGETRPSYPVAVFQEAGEVAVCRLEANEV